MKPRMPVSAPEIPIMILPSTANASRFDPIAAVESLTGSPVLMAWADHDFFFPEGNETQYWKAHCSCDVETWTQRESGHAFVAHKSMPTFTAAVVDWLSSRGLGAR